MEAKNSDFDFEPIVGKEMSSNGVSARFAGFIEAGSERLHKASEKVRQMHTRLGFRDAELHRAAIHDDVAKAKDLLDMGVDPLATHVGDAGITPLVRAVRGKHNAVFDLLLDATLAKHPNYLDNRIPATADTLAHVAADNENWYAYSKILKCRHTADLENGKFQAPIDIVAEKGNAQLLEETIRAGADPAAVGNDGTTVADKIVKGNASDKLDMLQVLHKHRVDLLAPFGPENQTLLMSSAQFGDREICEYLLLLGANPNARTNQSEYALHFSTLNEQPGVTRILLQHGANPNVWTAGDPDNGKLPATPLMLSAVYNNLDSAMALTDDPRTQPYLSVVGTTKTAVDLAKDRGHEEVGAALQEHLKKHEARMTSAKGPEFGKLIQTLQAPPRFPKPTLHKPR